MIILSEIAIASVNNSNQAFCKFISANDTGKTKGHQAGFYMPKDSIPLMFGEKGEKGFNMDRFVSIRWHTGEETKSRFVYYGKGTRNEYRLTRSYPHLNEENTGDLLVLCHVENDSYEGFVLSSDDDIDNFLSSFNLSPDDTNKLIPKDPISNPESKLFTCFDNFIQTISNHFPITSELASRARDCFNSAFRINEVKIIEDPDTIILNWINSEYKLFRLIEDKYYADRLASRFNSVEELVVFSNTVLNRRKSRAGKSLEYHLESIFKTNRLSFSNQATTEFNKKPDFLFPSQEAYLNPGYSSDKLVTLAAKTTCKDRWRQVINEADRIKTKHLFTLQPGISKNQLEEMKSQGVQLVIPRSHSGYFPKESLGEILTLDGFINLVRSKTSTPDIGILTV